MTRHAGTDQDFLAMALVGYEAQKAKINAAIAEIQAQLGHRGPGRPRVAADGAAPAKRVMSAAARRRIAAASSMASRRDLPAACSSLATSTIRMPCLLIRPIRVTSPT